MKSPFLLVVLINLFIANAHGENLGRMYVEIRGVKDKPKSTLICAVFDSKAGFPKESSKAIHLLDDLKRL